MITHTTATTITEMTTTITATTNSGQGSGYTVTTRDIANAPTAGSRQSQGAGGDSGVFGSWDDQLSRVWVHRGDVVNSGEITILRVWFGCCLLG